ncbi:hypothetical protein TEA_023776 [Camellia sinensis var. sinensis]|uniref:phospholipase D n=1 Tax=Camellia sinensis var. sinensis TaxID=542762 RepID=A0A4S4EPX9_CAMSN|nr:hypothetical protein TEA_023776 [Camellia sinensis var. sinensis]
MPYTLLLELVDGDDAVIRVDAPVPTAATLAAKPLLIPPSSLIYLGFKNEIDRGRENTYCINGKHGMLTGMGLMTMLIKLITLLHAVPKPGLHNTMQMMYEEIYKALEEVGLEKKYEPQDYLNFFCLGNREARDREDTSDAGNATTKNHSQELTRKNRRFMIDVHSKGMIVDDEYMILASANINQRSLESTRDTEIAMGAYQPHYTWASKHSTPRGQVHGYRMSLWSEHIGALEECFKHPESLECIRRVRSLSELNWNQYAANEVTDMKGHLLKYPVEVDQMGKVKPIPGCETFPDVGGNIIGSLGPINIKENLTI